MTQKGEAMPTSKTNRQPGFPCPKCGTNTGTIDSRPTGFMGHDSTRRRRKCLNNKCRKRFTTYELKDEYFIEAETGRKLLQEFTTVMTTAMKQIPRRRRP
jgi:transcriptional regulator NrdR family protein